MSAAPGPAPGPPAQGPTPPQTTPQTSDAAPMVAGFLSLGGIASLLFYVLYAYGAAKLSYDKFQSVGWAILDFIFPMFYYPYYAIFLSGPQQTMGGRRRR